MMAAKKLTLAKPETVEVVLSDPGSDVDRKYRVVLFTRSVKERLAEIGEQIQKEIDNENTDNDKFVRLICDQLNIALGTDNEDAPSAGDLLFAEWENERVTDDQIVELWAGIQAGTQDPT